ncbi:18725_t:CDS:2, partial [Gigaspora margarita]
HISDFVASQQTSLSTIQQERNNLSHTYTNTNLPNNNPSNVTFTATSPVSDYMIP